MYVCTYIYIYIPPHTPPQGGEEKKSEKAREKARVKAQTEKVPPHTRRKAAFVTEGPRERKGILSSPAQPLPQDPPPKEPPAYPPAARPLRQDVLGQGLRHAAIYLEAGGVQNKTLVNY